jgi:FkbM family methyltransferase
MITWKIGNVEFNMAVDKHRYSDRVLWGYANQNRIPEPEVVNFMLKALRPGDVVIDGGANVGFFTLLMAELVGPKGQVHAFEPMPQTVRQLDYNVGLNCLDHVVIHEQALGAQEGKAELWEHVNDGQSALYEMADSCSRRSVHVTTIDSLKVLPKLIKLDIEGSEEAAIRGAVGTLSLKAQPFVICELNTDALQAMQSSVDGLRKKLLDHDYHLFVLPPEGGFPVCVPSGIGLKLDRLNINVLFAPLDRLAELWPELEIK